MTLLLSVEDSTERYSPSLELVHKQSLFSLLKCNSKNPGSSKEEDDLEKAGTAFLFMEGNVWSLKNTRKVKQYKRKHHFLRGRHLETEAWWAIYWQEIPETGRLDWLCRKHTWPLAIVLMLGTSHWWVKPIIRQREDSSVRYCPESGSKEWHNMPTGKTHPASKVVREGWFYSACQSEVLQSVP